MMAMMMMVLLWLDALACTRDKMGMSDCVYV